MPSFTIDSSIEKQEGSIFGRARSLSIFEEFTLVIMRLCLGLFEKLKMLVTVLKL